ncbi:MAG: hypothetical protein UMV23_02520 [Halanaerobium sp.]|nr:hypothetical protein [Halanaerobium sp.]
MEKVRVAVRMGLLTFFLAFVLTLVSRSFLNYVHTWSAIILLLVIVSIGVIFDLIGVAATAAKEGPFNAKAAKKIPGSREALFLVKNADKVASFSCDIVGDICGTLSGAVGAAIVLRLVNNFTWNEFFIDLIIISLVASLTVGGKAYGKAVGIKRSNDIIFLIGRVLSVFKTRNAKDIIRGRHKRPR